MNVATKTASTKTFVVRNSLRDVLSVPQRTARDFSKQALPEAIARVKANWNSLKADAKPDMEAVEFYCLNHLLSMIQQRFHQDEPLPGWALEIARTYAEVLVRQSFRMYTYLVLITTRENRHQYEWNKEFTAKHKKKLGACAKVLKEFHQNWIVDKNEMGALNNLVTHAPQVTLGEYATHITFSFNHGEWSSSYGGPKWGEVSKCLEDTVYGRTSLEVMVDVGYALAHNGGPIFNKGMTYDGYTGQFLAILDLQRAGFIPTAVMLQTSGPVKHLAKEDGFSKLVDFCHWVQKEIGGIPEYIDYYKVAAFGVEGDYAYEKEKQVAAHGKPAITEYEKPAPKAAPEVEESDDGEPEGKAVYLYPGAEPVLSVKKERPPEEVLKYQNEVHLQTLAEAVKNADVKFPEVWKPFPTEIPAPTEWKDAGKPINLGQFYQHLNFKGTK